MNVFSESLRELRKANGITQVEVAKAIGITDRNYRRYETSGVQPATAISHALAEYFNVSIDYLVGRTDNPKVNL